MILEYDTVPENPMAPFRNNNFTILPAENPVAEELNRYRAAYIRHVTDDNIHTRLQRDLMEHHWNIEQGEDGEEGEE